MRNEENNRSSESSNKGSAFSAPSISLPKGGGAIRGIDEKFSVNPVTGTGSLSVSIFTSPSRSDFSPKLSLNYDSGAGNGPFGLGWNLSIPSITRKTDKGVPKYQDAEESDTFILSGAEDLVPSLEDVHPDEPSEYNISRYRPRIEGLFARIEKWEHKTTGEVFWRSISKDNITSIYGKTADSRISDPDDPNDPPIRVFKWLLEESYDSKGNVILYEYKQENDESKKEDKHDIDPALLPQEKNRIGKDYANRYLKRIKYGNKTPRSEDETPDPESDYLFEVVFDYGEHDKENPTPNDDKTHPWKFRQDAFSSCRAGFEIRTQRLCQRVLMFHQFEELGGACLVRSTDFSYQESPIMSYLAQITQTGYVRKGDASGYDSKSFPPLEFGYTKADIDETIRCIETESLENLPIGLDGAQYQWVDLDGEGISGILTEQGNAWFYKRNLSPIPVRQESGEETIVARFAPLEMVATKPSAGTLQRAQLMDLAGDGQKDLVLLDEPLSGFYERTEDGRWEAFVPFTSFPNVRWDNPNLRFVDLNGDGHADVLITDDEVFTWYPSKAEDGFGSSEQVLKERDEEKGPTLVFADATQSVYLADMSGDGLSDIVRIRNGDVNYWSNLGYGRFGAKVTMDAAPYFDSPDLFDQRRIRLADIDGSGTTDIIYLGRNTVSLWRNQSGNSWSSPRPLTTFPKIDNLASVTVVDLLGKGTACIVWSSPLPGESQQPMRYIDLMSQGKPHLLQSITNNLGAETTLQYASSTKFYLEDLEDGKPWTTRLPFPVHVLERVETYEAVSKTKLVQLYKYHHGYFDGEDREFRGFGLVEQWDTESFTKFVGKGLFTETPDVEGEEFHLPPVHTKTWFHTGAYFKRDNISQHFETEYYKDDPLALKALLPDTILPTGLTTKEEHEACRALKGRILRQEIYAVDDSPQSPDPYSVSERNYELEQIQPMLDNRHAVFYAYPRETIDFHYERHPDDPRVTHQITLDVDECGNITDSIAIAYPRRNPQFDEQAEAKITYTKVDFINKTTEDDWYYVGVPYQNRAYEITGINWSWPDPFQWLTKETFTEISSDPDSFQPYEWQRPEGFVGAAKRIIEWDRSYFRQNAGADELDEADDMAYRLTLGEIESLGLPYESYRAAFTDSLLQAVYEDRYTEALMAEGRYHREPDQPVYWWIPSGRQAFMPESFYLPYKSRDPFGNVYHINYDNKYSLFIESTKDPLNNIVQAEYNYRVLQPKQITDPNGNRSAVSFDELGMVVATAVMGKAGETDPEKMGDTLDDPTTRLKYELFEWKDHKRPNFAMTEARERHRDPETPWQKSYTYSDGLGREVMTKIQAEPGSAPERDPITREVVIVDGEVQMTHTDSRWVGTGRTVYDNKGNPVKQYEPFFSDTYKYEDEAELVNWGVTPILRYDPLGRLIRTDNPNGTFSKVEFDAWQQITCDENDTLKDSQWLKQIFPDFDPNNPPTIPTTVEEDAAIKTLTHAETPTIAHLDVLGRLFLTIADNGLAEDGTEQKYNTRIELDIEGNQRKVIDAKDRIVMRYDYDMLGNQIKQNSMDAGERWMLNNVVGNPMKGWDSRNHELSYVYDKLQRPTLMHVKGGDSGTPLDNIFERILYGDWEGMTAAEKTQGQGDNLIGNPKEHYDTAGKIQFERYDFKGNLKKSIRRLAPNYTKVVDWKDTNLNDLENEPFTTETKYDALNRVIETKTPDRSITIPTYNEANLLEKVDVRLRGAPATTHFVTNINYNAKGQREFIEYGNRVRAAYKYDPLTFRLVHLFTTRGTEFPDDCSNPDPCVDPPHDCPSPRHFPCGVQNLHYTYDPVGNITHIRDDAQQTIYFRNRRVEPSSEYTYDAIYRLIKATGREHLGQAADGSTLPPPAPQSYRCPAREPAASRRRQCYGRIYPAVYI